jgi:hypothetical protein
MAIHTVAHVVHIPLAVRGQKRTACERQICYGDLRYYYNAALSDNLPEKLPRALPRQRRMVKSRFSNGWTDSAQSNVVFLN